MGGMVTPKTKAFPNAQLKRLREARGFSQAKLADLVGCGQGDIAKLETGAKRTTADWAIRLAPPLGVDPRELFPGLGAAAQGGPASAGLDPEKLSRSLMIARRMAAAHGVGGNEAAITGLAAAIYDVLAESEAVGAPALDDQAALSLIERVLRRIWRPPPA
jgi:transcriptional regulator with XRE-family HTH domain